MTIINAEKHSMFIEHEAHIFSKPIDYRTTAEIEWLPWAAKRITELEAS